jgi:starvation-inducible DNA-binding protein
MESITDPQYMTRAKAFRKLGFTPEETQTLVMHMNRLLANYHIHYQKLRNFHWNVKGNDFFELHEVFENLYDKVYSNIDELAERIRVFGHTPFSTLREYLHHAELAEVATNLSGKAMVREVLDDITILLSFMMDVSNAAQEIGDIGTIDLVNDFVKGMEKDHWMLNAWITEKE